MARRLYVAGSGKDLVFCTAENASEAKMALGKDYRIPDSDDVRLVWQFGKLDQMSAKELFDLLKVRRQTVDYWFRKAGGNLPRRSDRLREDREQRVQAQLRRKPLRSATAISQVTNTRPEFVMRMAQEMGLVLPTKQKRPSDDELVKMAAGKTWHEFAKAADMALSSLRNYIYAKPELAERIAAVRQGRPRGPQSHGQVDPKKIVLLANKGMSAYSISVQLSAEPEVVYYWVRKAQKANDAPTRHPGTSEAVVGSSRRGSELHK